MTSNYPVEHSSDHPDGIAVDPARRSGKEACVMCVYLR